MVEEIGDGHCEEGPGVGARPDEGEGAGGHAHERVRQGRALARHMVGGQGEASA